MVASIAVLSAKFTRLFFLCLLLWGAGAAAQTSYLELRQGQPVCLPQEYTPEVFSGAQWEMGQANGKPFLLARIEGEVAGYLFLTHQLVDMVAYSGKPLEILVALSPEGTILSAELIAHSEPILLVGIPEKVLHDFIAQFAGRNIERLLLDNIAGESKIALDGASGATVTVLIADQVILTAAKMVAREAGILARMAVSQTLINDRFDSLAWTDLTERGLLHHAVLEAEEIEGPEGAGRENWLDLYYGVLNQPSLGVNLLGRESYDRLLADYPGKTLLILLNNGSYSFRGSGFVRGGIFDRLQVTQGMEIIRFRDSDYHYQFRLQLEDAPDIQEKAIYAVPQASFNGALPWELEVLVTKRSHETAKAKKFIHFKTAYALPDDYLIAPTNVDLAGPSLVTEIWSGKKVWIGLYLLLWAVVITSFIMRRRLSNNRTFLDYFHLAVLLCSILLLGIGQKGQPSVVNIFTFVDVQLALGGLGPFLTEPFLFISWIAITATTLLWGRGPFCGWICPYGGLMELSFFIRNKLVPQKWRRSLELPAAWHNRLKHFPVVLFAVLLTISLFSLKLAEMLAEIEPFKTTWLVGVSNRPWYLALYWAWLLAMGLVTVRFFCRYLCPLGGYIALLARLQIFKIPRRNFCSTCNICAKGCSTQAIDRQGQIDPKQCFGCLECINKMHDPKVCPPLIKPQLWEEYEAPSQRAS
ncbi:MAG: 4Fe-4S binding protein [Candidatus Latescibacteria bacterium]|nr:4Fe-4S binding protein [Candidatus Latescibacterota bacterium]